MADLGQDRCSACGGSEFLRKSPWHGEQPICKPCFLIWYDASPDIDVTKPEEVGRESLRCKAAGEWPWKDPYERRPVMGEEYVVFLPISLEQADMIGMPSATFEQAVRRLGRKVPARTDDDRSLKIDALADALEQMWSGGGEYGVYTVAVQRDKVRQLLHELLTGRRLT